MKKEEYLRQLTEQIRCEKARDPVAEEIRGHIEDQQEAFLSEGMDRLEAEEAAVREMGDPVEAGAELDRIHRPKMAWGMIGLVVVLSFAGLGIQYALEQTMPDVTFTVGSLLKQVVLLVLGLGIMTVVCFLDYSWFGKWARQITVLLTGAIIIGISAFGASVNGMTAWAGGFFGIFINLRMVLLLFIPLYGAILYSCRGQGYWALAKGFLWMLPPVCLSFAMPSTVTAFLMFGACMLTLSMAVYKGWFEVSRRPALAAVWGSVVLFPAAFVIFLLRFGAAYQVYRIRAFIDPSGGAENYQIRVIREILAGSRLVGGQGSQLTPASDGVDYVLTCMISSYGILAAVLLIGAITFLFLRLWTYSRRQKNQLGMIMGTGCAAVLILQILLYVLGNTGVLPVESYCPFLTAGGSGSLVTYVMIGLLLSIYRYQNVITEHMLVSGKSKKKNGLLAEK